MGAQQGAVSARDLVPEQTTMCRQHMAQQHQMGHHRKRASWPNLDCSPASTVRSPDHRKPKVNPLYISPATYEPPAHIHPLLPVSMCLHTHTTPSTAHQGAPWHNSTRLSRCQNKCQQAVQVKLHTSEHVTATESTYLVPSNTSLSAPSNNPQDSCGCRHRLQGLHLHC